MDLETLRKKTGNIQQEIFVRPVIFNEGRARGMNAWLVKNGQINFTVMADKCLDIADFSYKGMNLSFLSKPGLTGRAHYDTNGDEALRSIMGGLLFTSGFENICPPCTDEAKDYPMHGRMRSTPAEHLSADILTEKDRLIVRISGEMREAELFGENMVLKRTIESEYGSKTVTVRDVITNFAFRDEVLMLLYHCNFGYPLLDEGAEIISPTKSVTPRDENSRAGVDSWHTMPAPVDNQPEQVFIHDLAQDEQGNTFAGIINRRLNLGVKISFNKRNLPQFFQWKSAASGDYVIGLEPANSSVYGRLAQKKLGLHKLSPGQSEVNELQFTILDGEEELKNFQEEAKNLPGNRN